MSSITTVFCWAGGVLLPAIPDLAIQLIQNEDANPVDFWQRKSIRDLAEDLFLGKLNGPSFCQRLIKETGALMSPEDLEAAHLDKAVPQIGVLEVLAELQSRYEIRLISDYPLAWFERLADRFTAFPFIHTEQVIFTNELGLTHLVPDIFPLLPQAAHQHLKSCMLVDRDSRRAVEAVRYGLSAAILIDPFRFRREFILRKMLLASR
jgi:hypothetical protein